MVELLDGLKWSTDELKIKGGEKQVSTPYQQTLFSPTLRLVRRKSNLEVVRMTVMPLGLPLSKFNKILSVNKTSLD